MSAELEAVLTYVRAATTPYRTGEVVAIDHTENLTAVTIDAFPALPSGILSTVDCHFIKVGFTEALASMSHQEFYDLVISATEGAFQLMTLADWARGPSYIEVGCWIGDQTDALRFMALCAAHGLAEVITPERLHIPAAQQDLAAGNGYVLLSPLTAPKAVTSGS